MRRIFGVRLFRHHFSASRCRIPGFVFADARGGGGGGGGGGGRGGAGGREGGGGGRGGGRGSGERGGSRGEAGRKPGGRRDGRGNGDKKPEEIVALGSAKQVVILELSGQPVDDAHNLSRRCQVVVAEERRSDG